MYNNIVVGTDCSSKANRSVSTSSSLATAD